MTHFVLFETLTPSKTCGGGGGSEDWCVSTVSKTLYHVCTTRFMRLV